MSLSVMCILKLLCANCLEISQNCIKCIESLLKKLLQDCQKGNAQDCGILKAARNTYMLHSKFDPMKVRLEPGIEAEFGFCHPPMPSCYGMLPPKAEFETFQVQPIFPKHLPQWRIHQTLSSIIGFKAHLIIILSPAERDIGRRYCKCFINSFRLYLNFICVSSRMYRYSRYSENRMGARIEP